MPHPTLIRETYRVYDGQNVPVYSFWTGECWQWRLKNRFTEEWEHYGSFRTADEVDDAAAFAIMTAMRWPTVTIQPTRMSYDRDALTK